MPVPQVEEPERFPGGVDALCDRLGYGEITTLPLGVDLPTYPAGQPSGDELRRRQATSSAKTHPDAVFRTVKPGPLIRYLGAGTLAPPLR